MSSTRTVPVASTTLPPPRFEGYHTQVGLRFAQLYRELQRQTGEIVPPRPALTVSFAREVIQHLSILELESPERVIVRLMGTAVCRRMGTDGTGTNYFDFIQPAERTAYQLHFHNLITRPCGAVALVTEHYRSLESVAEHVSFPFCDKYGRRCYNISVSQETDAIDLNHLPGKALSSGKPLRYRQIEIGGGIDPMAEQLVVANSDLH